MTLRPLLALSAALVSLLALGLLPAAPTTASDLIPISGVVRLPTRDNHSGTLIVYDGVIAAVTDYSGAFVLHVAPGGGHLLRARHSRYLSRQYFLDDPQGAVTLPATTLRLGDPTEDDQVNMVDLVLVTGVYGTRPPGDPRADLNGDGAVEFADLLGVLANYGLSGPLPWVEDSGDESLHTGD